MTSRTARAMATGLLAALALGGCAAKAPADPGVQPVASGGTRPSGDWPRPVAPPSRHTPADVEFIEGMIQHHAQAVLIAGWAPTHGASEEVRRLAERIVVGQQDETDMMERWLRKVGAATPVDSAHHAGSGMDHSGAGHSGHDMPGMLTAEQLARLDRARGREFDRLFLTLMIEHHKGALVMVEQLFASPGAAQDDTVFRIASDVQAEQTAEIQRMERMIAALPPEGPGS